MARHGMGDGYIRLSLTHDARVHALVLQEARGSTFMYMHIIYM